MPKQMHLAAWLCCAVLQATAALADPFDDWLAGKPDPARYAIRAGGQALELKFSHPAPPASLLPPIFEQAFSWLKRASNGRLVFSQYAGGTLHGAKDGFRALRGGISDSATCYTVYEHRGFELNEVFNQPFVSPERSLAATRMHAELAEQYFAGEFERRGVEHGYSSLFQRTDLMSRTPVRTLEDLRGKKIITIGMSPATASALGIVGLNIPFPDIYTALSQGLADGVFWFDTGFLPYRIYEVAPFRTVVGLYSGAIDTCLSRRASQRIPADLKPLFNDFQQALAGMLSIRVGHDFSRKAEAIYTAKGVTTYHLEAEELARWKTATRPAIQHWLERCAEAGKPCRELLADVERLKQQYATMSNDELMRLILESPVPHSP